MGGYKYNGTGTTMTPEQVEEHLHQVRARLASTPRSGARDGAATSALATSSQARDAALHPPRIVPGEVVHAQPAIQPPQGAPPQPDARRGPEPGALRLKGAVRVQAFPERCKYPFRQIADDGGIWRLDPAEFKVTAGAIKQAAPKWAQANGLAAKCVVDDDQVYVQFTAAGE